MGSKKYFKSKRTGFDSGEYFSRMWTARANKDNARSFISKRSEVELALSEEIYKLLYENNILATIMIEDGEYKEEHCLLMPPGFAFIKLLQEQDLTKSLDGIPLDNILKQANYLFYQEALTETWNRIQDPL